MKKEETQKIINSDVVKDFTDICPQCDTKAHLQMLYNESYRDNNRNLIYFVIFRCVPCKKLVLETFKFDQNQYSQEEYLSIGRWENKFPSPQMIYTNKFEGSVPSDVFEDFKEGVISLDNNCYKASVSMFRRSLQSAVVNLGGTGDTLINQIKSLDNLTKDIKDWAHNIRIFGNWGAHAQDDNLKEVDCKLAEEVKLFLEQFFNYVYVMPNLVTKAREKSNSKVENIKEE